MNKFNIIKKVMSIVYVLTVIAMTLPIGTFVEAAMINCYLGISGPSVSKVKAGGTVTFTLTYSGNVDTVWLGSGSIVLNGFTANKKIEKVGTDTSSKAVRRVTLTNVQGIGSGKTISITGGTAVASTGDLANAIDSSRFTIEAAAPVDTVKPNLTIVGPNPASIYPGASVSFTAKYTDDKGISKIWIGNGSIVLNGFTANIKITGSGNDRIITLDNIQGAVGGNKTISITGGTAIDAAGNLANSATSSAFTIAQKPVVPQDTVPPVLKITGPNPSSIYAGQTVTYTATYTDDKGISKIWIGNGSIVLNGFTANVRITGTGNTRTITLANVQGSIGGNKTISITGGTAIDAAGNLANAATSLGFEIKKDEETPTYPVDPTPPVNKPDDWVPNPNTGK